MLSGSSAKQIGEIWALIDNMADNGYSRATFTCEQTAWLYKRNEKDLRDTGWIQNIN